MRTVVLDVADPSSCAEAMGEVARMTGGGAWAVVNNAGVPQAGSIEDVSDEQARHLLEVNLLGAMRIYRLALPQMRLLGEGRIVNVSSALGRVPWPLGGWYSASKHALSALTHCLRVEMAHAGVRVRMPAAWLSPHLGGNLMGSPGSRSGWPTRRRSAVKSCTRRAAAASGSCRRSAGSGAGLAGVGEFVQAGASVVRPDPVQWY